MSEEGGVCNRCGHEDWTVYCSVCVVAEQTEFRERAKKAEAEVERLREVGKRVLMLIDSDLEKHGLTPGKITDEGDWIHEFRLWVKSDSVAKGTEGK